MLKFVRNWSHTKCVWFETNKHQNFECVGGTEMILNVKILSISWSKDSVSQIFSFLAYEGKAVGAMQIFAYGNGA
jgi:hypothetical protein